jgi:hypothetical protein
MAVIIMSAVILAGIAAPCGLADLPLQAMALGIDAVVGVIRVSGASGWIVATFLIGGVLICALCGWFRAFGLIGVLAAVVGLPLTSAPNVLVSGQGRLAALIKDEKLLATSLRAGDLSEKYGSVTPPLKAFRRWGKRSADLMAKAVSPRSKDMRTRCRLPPKASRKTAAASISALRSMVSA